MHRQAHAIAQARTQDRRGIQYPGWVVGMTPDNNKKTDGLIAFIFFIAVMCSLCFSVSGAMAMYKSWQVSIYVRCLMETKTKTEPYYGSVECSQVLR
jgi:hypothetical protein